MKKALITGITGQDGKADLQALLEVRQCQDVIRQLSQNKGIRAPGV